MTYDVRLCRICAWSSFETGLRDEQKRFTSSSRKFSKGVVLTQHGGQINLTTRFGARRRLSGHRNRSRSLLVM